MSDIIETIENSFLHQNHRDKDDSMQELREAEALRLIEATTSSTKG